MGEKILIKNGKLILKDRILQKGYVCIENKKITTVGEGDADELDQTVIDVNGNFISPGFIDIHVHGGNGYDFMDATEEAFVEISKIHAAHGTTSMMPTTLTAEKEDLINTLDTYDRVKDKQYDGAAFVGLHLEGPYFSMNQRGAQDPKFIRDPDPDEYKEIISRSPSIKRWSAAPERKGAIEFGKYLKQNGILASMAHTDALYEEAMEAYHNGYSLLTHFYSAMSGVTRRNAHRYAGVVEAGYLHDELDVEIIADGIHLPAPLLKLIYKIKGPDHTALITDAMRAAGMPEGESYLGNKKNAFKVIVEEGVAKLPDRSAFAGSVALADRLIRTMIEKAEVPLVEAIRMITATPARILGLDKSIGVLHQGYDADLVIFDEKINIKYTFVKGKQVYQSPT